MLLLLLTVTALSSVGSLLWKPQLHYPLIDASLAAFSYFSRPKRFSYVSLPNHRCEDAAHALTFRFPCACLGSP